MPFALQPIRAPEIVKTSTSVSLFIARLRHGSELPPGLHKFPVVEALSPSIFDTVIGCQHTADESLGGKIIFASSAEL